MKKIIHLFFENGVQNKKGNLLRVVDGLANSQLESGEKVEVWTISDLPRHTQLQKAYTTKCFESHWSRFALNTKLIEEIQQLSSGGMFHLHGGFVPEFYTIAKFLKLKGMAYVVTPHGVHGNKITLKNEAIKAGYCKHLEKYFLQNATFIHCATDEEAVNIQKMGEDFQHILLIPQGEDVASFRMQPREDAAAQTPVFGFCGSILRNQRSLELLLDAFKIYKCESKGKGKLWLIAEENSQEYLSWSSSMCEIKEDVAFFGGEKEQKYKRHLMSQLDAFYEPSYQEEYNQHVLEAAAMGKPIVISGKSHINSYISAYMAGICLVKSTPKEIASSMKKLADLKKIGLLDKLGTSARQMAEDHFDWKIISRRMLDAYANLGLAA